MSGLRPPRRLTVVRHEVETRGRDTGSSNCHTGRGRLGGFAADGGLCRPDEGGEVDRADQRPAEPHGLGRDRHDGSGHDLRIADELEPVVRLPRRRSGLARRRGANGLGRGPHRGFGGPWPDAGSARLCRSRGRGGRAADDGVGSGLRRGVRVSTSGPGADPCSRRGVGPAAPPLDEQFGSHHQFVGEGQHGGSGVFARRLPVTARARRLDVARLRDERVDDVAEGAG